MHVAGKALQHHKACSAALVSLDIGEEQRRVIHSVAMTGKFQSIELSSHNMSLDHTLWPPIGESRESKTAFIVHGKADVTALWTHYETVMERQNASKEDTLHEYRLFKMWARSRATSARETFLALLQRGTSSHKLGISFDCTFFSSFDFHVSYLSVSDDLQKKFRCLGVLVEIYLTMAISTVVCERGFSCLKRIKSDWR